MAFSTPTDRFTYQDYLNTPEDKRYELLEGDLVTIATPGELHQSVSAQPGWRLVQFASENNLGRVYHAPFDVVLSDTDVVQPDLLFVSREREHILLGGVNVRGAPDLVVEILSPSTSGRDKTVKSALYARHGVREYWLADPEAKTITVMVLGEAGFEVEAIYGKGHTLTSPTLEGFTVDLDEIL